MSIDESTTRARRGVVRVARWSATHPWRAVLIWVVFVAACLAAGQACGVRHATNLEMGVGDSGRAARLVHDAGLQRPDTENVLITARHGTDTGLARSASARATARDAARRMRSLPGVAGVAAPVPAKDGTALLVPVRMAGDADTAVQRVQPLLDATAAVQRDHPGLRVAQVGTASVSQAVSEHVGSGLRRALRISLPVTLLILLIAFGALIAAGVPVLLGMSAVAAAVGAWGLASQVFPDVGSVTEVISLIGMAVGVDYSLFYLRRAREQRARGDGRLDAIEIAAATSGRAVLVSGVAVVISAAGLYLANDVIFRGLASGSILVVAIAVIGSLTVLPALLGLLGDRVDRPRVPLLWRLTAARGEPRVWPALLRPALRHPVIALVLSVAALGALALPAAGMHLRQSGDGDLPRSVPAIRAYDRMVAAFPSQDTAHQVVVRAPAAEAGQVGAALRRLTERAGGDPLFTPRQHGTVTASADRTVHTVEVTTPYRDNTAPARRSLTDLRDRLIPATVGRVPGAKALVGGDVAQEVDYGAHVSAAMPKVIAFVLALTLVVMLLSFGSIGIALVTVAVNGLSALAAFGLLTLVFQHTWAEGLLDFRSNGAVASWVPMFLFVVLFGLSMDYHVFLLSRIRERLRPGVPVRTAVAEGITHSAGVVTSAAAIMVSVFAIFASLDLIETKELGVGLAAAVLIDAVVIRIVVLPALLTVLGRAAWWTPRRRHPGDQAPDPVLATR